ncbi:hypothetical protein Bbelb_359710 [Branchiostoma belcheri]|nr:hypothetical protein Bbelb_359710 [Branchiostoma belcheri]
MARPCGKDAKNTPPRMALNWVPQGKRRRGGTTNDLEKTVMRDLVVMGITWEGRHGTVIMLPTSCKFWAEWTNPLVNRKPLKSSGFYVPAQKHERSPSGSRQEPARDLTAARPNCKSRSAPYHTPHGSRRATDRAPDGSLTETGRKIRRTLGVMTPAGVYTEDMPNGRRFKSRRTAQDRRQWRAVEARIVDR